MANGKCQNFKGHQGCRPQIHSQDFNTKRIFLKKTKIPVEQKLWPGILQIQHFGEREVVSTSSRAPEVFQKNIPPTLKSLTLFIIMHF